MENELKIKRNKKINNILLLPTVFYFLIILNRMFSWIDFYEVIDNIYFYFLAYLFPFILTSYVYTFHKRIKTGKIFTIFFTLSALLFSLFILLSTLLFLLFKNQDSHYVLYISKYNKNKMIVVIGSDGGGGYSTVYEESVHTIYDFPPILKFISNIDTNDIDTNDWIKLKYNQDNGRSQLFDDIEFSRLKVLGDSDFLYLNLKLIDTIKLPKELSYKIHDYRWYYSKQRSKGNYYTYILFTEGDLILQTIDRQYKGISYIEIYSDIHTDEYNFKKTCFFENDSVLTINKYYETFELDKNKKMIPNSLIKVNLKNRYKINYMGEFEELSEAEFDDVKITLPK